MVALPVLASKAAIRLLDCPPIVVKAPPTYTVEPFMIIEFTVLFASGLHEVGTPVVLSRAAIFVRACPPTVAKDHPIYTVEPSTVIA